MVATHPDQALAMLAEPTPLHREVLGAIRYQPNIAQLHTDERLLPRAEGARASWNYQRRDDGRVLVTYDMTRLHAARPERRTDGRGSWSAWAPRTSSTRAP